MKRLFIVCVIMGAALVLADALYFEKNHKATDPVYAAQQAHRSRWPRYIGAAGMCIGLIAMLATKNKKAAL